MARETHELEFAVSMAACLDLSARTLWRSRVLVALLKFFVDFYDDIEQRRNRRTLEVQLLKAQLEIKWHRLSAGESGGGDEALG